MRRVLAERITNVSNGHEKAVSHVQCRLFPKSSHLHPIQLRTSANYSTGQNGLVVGIDLGTTNSCVATLEGGTPRVIENEEGSRITPSVVGFLHDGNIVVGAAAKRQSLTNSQRTIHAIKRLIGRPYDEELVKKEKNMISYSILPAPNGDAWVDIGGKSISPSEISAHILSYLKHIAERFLQQTVTEAVITVPAYFNDKQKQATLTGGTLAGLQVQRIISEPTAAALAYGFRESDSGKTLAVFDLGGGTFDISIVDIEDNVFEVRATNGDTFLGGEDYDLRIVEWVIKKFRKRTGIDLSNDLVAVHRIREAAEQAKIALSSVRTAPIILPYIRTEGGTAQHIHYTLQRTKLETLVEDLVERMDGPCKKCIRDADLQVSNISEVLLVGGMTRMPLVQEKVLQLFQKKPSKGINPDEAVAMGAAIQAGILQGSVAGLVVIDVNPLSVGVELAGDVFSPLIPRNTNLPCKRTRMYTTTKDLQPRIEIIVRQGESKKAHKNTLLGTFSLAVPPAPKGVPQIEITFLMDTNGVVHVSAVDTATNKKKTVRMEAKRSLISHDIETKMVESTAHLEEKRRNDLKVAKMEAEKTLSTLDSILKVFHWRELQKDDHQRAMAHVNLMKTKVEEAKKKLDTLSDPKDVVELQSSLSKLMMETLHLMKLTHESLETRLSKLSKKFGL